MSTTKRISQKTKKHRSARLRAPEVDTFLSAEEVDKYLLPEKEKARAHDRSGKDMGAEAVRRRFAELAQQFQRD